MLLSYHQSFPRDPGSQTLSGHHQLYTTTPPWCRQTTVPAPSPAVRSSMLRTLSSVLREEVFKNEMILFQLGWWIYYRERIRSAEWSWKWGRILCYHQTFLSILALKTYSGPHQLYNRNVEEPWPSHCSELQQPQNSLHSLERSWYPEKGFCSAVREHLQHQASHTAAPVVGLFKYKLRRIFKL